MIRRATAGQFHEILPDGGQGGQSGGVPCASAIEFVARRRPAGGLPLVIAGARPSDMEPAIASEGTNVDVFSPQERGVMAKKTEE